MSADEYPHLGFDPAPGTLSSIDDLTAKLSKTVSGLKKAHTVLTEIGKGAGEGAWEGEAADAFSKKVGDLPKYLDDSHDALQTAQTQLSKWRTELAGYQKTARRYEAEAKAAQARKNAAETDKAHATNAYNSAAVQPGVRPGAPATAPQGAAHDRLTKAGDAMDAASGRVDAAQDDLDAIVKKAKDLLSTHQEHAETIAGRLRKANDKAPDTGFFEDLSDAFSKLGHQIQEWCTKHADMLKEVGDWLSDASAVLGVMSLATLWCPPLSAGLALASAGASAGALASHGAAKLGGADVGATDLVGDGLGAIPVTKLGTVLAKGAKVPMAYHKVGEATVAGIDETKKIESLSRAGYQMGPMDKPWYMRALPEGSKHFTAKGFGNRMQLAWDSHVHDTIGSSFKEKRLSDAVEKIAPERIKQSLGSAVRADGTLDPTSWWSRGSLIGTQAPGIALDTHHMLTGSEAPAAGR